MKVPCSVIFLVLSTSWICAAEHSIIPADSEDKVNATESVTTEPATLASQDQEINVPVNISEEEIAFAVAQESEAANTIEPELRPTKRPKRPHLNKRPANEHKPQHHFKPEFWPFFPALPQMPYPAPCSYPQPMYYPMPVYSPYFFPTHPSEMKSPSSPLELDSEESSDSGEEVNAQELLRHANFWNNRFANKMSAKNTTTTVKPTKRLLIKNWVTNKLNRKTTTPPSPPSPSPTSPPGP